MALATRCQLALSSGLAAILLRSYWAWFRTRLVTVTATQAAVLFLLQAPTLVPLIVLLADVHVAFLRFLLTLTVQVGLKAATSVPLVSQLGGFLQRWGVPLRRERLRSLADRVLTSLGPRPGTTLPDLWSAFLSRFLPPVRGPMVVHFAKVSPRPVIVVPERRPPRPVDPTEESAPCTICYANARAVCAVPCGHNLFCYDCLLRHVTTVRATCPTCNTPVREIIHVYH